MKRNALVGNIAALVFGLAVATLAGEILLRQVVTLPLPRTEPEVRYEPHPVRGFTLMPSQKAFTYGAPVTIDAQGFRSNGGETESGSVLSAQTASDPFTLLALGDSFTFGLGVADQETWPARLEATLKARSTTPMRVVNAGTISYDVFHEMDLLRRDGLALRPGVVIHGLYWNDFLTPGPPDVEGVLTPAGHFTWDAPPPDEHPLHAAAARLSSRSALLFSMRRALGHLREDGRGEYGAAYRRMVERGLTEEEWAPIENFYRDFIRLSREAGFVGLVVIMPVDDIVAGAHPSRHPYAEQARQKLDALGLPYVDALALWEAQGLGRELFFPQGADSHLTAEGYRWIADAVAHRLLAKPAVRAALDMAP